MNKNTLVAIVCVITALLNFATGFTLRQSGGSGTVYLSLGIVFVIIAAVFLKRNRDRRTGQPEK